MRRNREEADDRSPEVASEESMLHRRENRLLSAARDLSASDVSCFAMPLCSMPIQGPSSWALFQVTVLTAEIKLGHGGDHTLSALFWKPKEVLNVPRLRS